MAAVPRNRKRLKREQETLGSVRSAIFDLRLLREVEKGYVSYSRGKILGDWKKPIPTLR